MQFTAEVTHTSDSENFLQGRINPGDTITGTYTYDTSMSDLYPDLIEVGRYEYDTPPSGISVQAGGFESRSDPDNTDFSIKIVNDSTPAGGGSWDEFTLVSENNTPFDGGLAIYKLSLDFYDDSARAISSDTLPSDALIVDGWPIAEVSIDGQYPGLSKGRGQFGIRGDLTSAVLIPEPATVLLLGVGCMVLLRSHRRHANA